MSLSSTTSQRTLFRHLMSGGMVSLCLVSLWMGGCASVPSTAPSLSIASLEEGNINPLFVKTENPYYLWEGVVDVIDNYFPETHERPIRTLEGPDANGARVVTRTEGRIDTEPVIAAGLLQPWRQNSANLCQRVEATFQTMRRKAVVRIVPADGGYLIHLAVYNELENLPNPMGSNTSGGSLSFSEPLSQLEFPAGESAPPDGWIPVGRNEELEEHILREIAWRLNNPPEIINPQNTQPKEIVP